MKRDENEEAGEGLKNAVLKSWVGNDILLFYKHVNGEADWAHEATELEKK